MATMTECPNHAGAFDCSPFCALCEGAQEVPIMIIRTPPNGKEREREMDDYLEEECTEPAPANIEFYQTTFGGEGRARCTECEFVSAYWECGCELMHECEGN